MRGRVRLRTTCPLWCRPTVRLRSDARVCTSFRYDPKHRDVGRATARLPSLKHSTDLRPRHFLRFERWHWWFRFGVLCSCSASAVPKEERSRGIGFSASIGLPLPINVNLLQCSPGRNVAPSPVTAAPVKNCCVADSLAASCWITYP